MGFLVLLLFPIAAWILPGYWLSRWRLPTATPLARTATSLLFGLVTVVPLGYVLSYGLRTPLTPLLVLAAAALVSIVAVLGARRYPVASTADDAPSPGQSRWVVLGVLLLVMLAAMCTRLQAVDATALFSPCLHESGLVLAEDGSGGGLETYDHRLGGMVTHLTARPHEQGYGLEHILGHQRPGSMAAFGQGLVFHGSGAPVVMLILYDLLVALMAALLFAKWVRSLWGVLLLTGVFLMGCHTVSAYMLNENMLALALMLGLWWMAPRTQRAGDALLLGGVLVLAVALRPVALCALPAVLVLMPRVHAGWAGLLVGLVVFALPWWVTNGQNFGSIWAHPPVSLGKYEQSFWGMTFTFHPLNWPVADTLLRGADSPFPNWFRVPLEHLAAFGAVFWTLAFLGAAAVGRRIVVAAALFAAPVLLLLCVIVSLDHQKLSYGLLAFAPLPTLVGAGVAALVGAKPVGRARKVLALVLALAFIVGLPALAQRVPSTVDSRDQYHTTNLPSGVTVDGERARLLATYWGPNLRPHLWTVAAAKHNGELLLQGRPPQRSRGEEVSGPTVLWMDYEDVAVAFRAPVTEGTALTKLMANSDMGCHSDYGFIGASLYLEQASPTVKVRAQVDRGVLTLAITDAGAGDTRGTVSFGVHHDNAFRDVVVSYNDAPLPVQFLVREDPRDGGPPHKQVRIVSNHGWHYVPDRDRVRVQSGLDRSVCGHPEAFGRRVGVAPGILLWSDGGRSCRFRTVTALDGAGPEPACPAVQFPSPTQ